MYQQLAHVVVLLLSAAYTAVDARERILVSRPKGTHYHTLLTLDAGGLRQHMTNQILVEVERKIKEYALTHLEVLPADAGVVSDIDDLEVHLADFFDCIGGVSAGSWVGLYYASKGGHGAVANILSRPDIVRRYGDLYPGSAAALDVFFEEYGGRIYPQDASWHLPRFSFDWRSPVTFPGVNAPRFPSDGLEEALEEFYGNTRLSDLHTSIIVNAFDTHRRTPVLFTHNNAAMGPRRTATTLVHSRMAPFAEETLTQTRERLEEETRLGRRPGLDMAHGEDFYIRDIARASSALPAVHVAKELRPLGNDTKQYVCIDGAIVEGNPTLHSINFMMRVQEVSDIHRIAILSLGTGVVVGEWAENVGRGAIGWLLTGDLISIIVDSGVEAIQANLEYLLYEELGMSYGQYLRIQVFAERESVEGEAMVEFTNPSPNTLGALKEIGRRAAIQESWKIGHFVQDYIFGTEALPRRGAAT